MALGAHPTKSNVKLLLSSHPLSSCSIKAQWRKEGGLRDAVVVNPVVMGGGGGGGGRGKTVEKSVRPNVRRAKELFGAKDKGEGKGGGRR